MSGSIIRKMEDRMSNKTWERWFKIKTMFSIHYEKKEFIKLLWARNSFDITIATVMFTFISICLVGSFLFYPNSKTVGDYILLVCLELVIFILTAPLVLLPIISLLRKRKDDPSYYKWLVQHYCK